MSAPVPRDPRIRTYPWPYRSALAISNDCDFLALPAMLGLRHLISGAIGLEYSDSFFFYQNKADLPAYSYFNGFTEKPSTAAPVIEALVPSGHLDTTHALGDFEAGGFTRQRAEAALAALQKFGGALRVWSNHGGFGNIQNIGTTSHAYHHSGDDIHRHFYVLDIAEDIGIRYYWTDSLLSRRMPLRPAGTLANAAEQKVPREIVLSGRQTIIRDFKWSFTHDRHDVLDVVTTRVGARLQAFIRYNPFLPENDAGITDGEMLASDGRRPGPNLGRIALTLSDEMLDKFVAAEGCAFLYQHFSTLSHLPQRRVVSEAIEFHPANLAALRRLKTYEDAGKIWVASQAILLDYLVAINTIDIEVSQLADGVIGIAVRARPGFVKPVIDGVTIEIEAGCRKAIFTQPDGWEGRATLVGPDADGRRWAMLPIRRLPRMDWRRVARLSKIELPTDPRVTLFDAEKPVNLWWPGS